MEPISLTTSIIALAGLFNNAIDCFEYIQLGRNFRRDYGTSLLKLDDARLRLSRWGESVGLSGDMKDTEALRHSLQSTQVDQARSRLDQIHKLFNDAEEVSRKLEKRGKINGVNHGLHGTVGLEPSTQSLHVKMRELAIKRQNGTTLRQKAKWAIYEEKHFRELIQDVTELVAGLIHLFPGSEASQRVLCAAEVAELHGEDLPVLSAAIAGQDSDLEAAITKALAKAETEAPRVVLSGSNNGGFQMGVNNGHLWGFTIGGRVV